MPNAWLTPNDAPSELVEYSLFFPPEQEYKRAFIGAFFLLTQAQNWEEWGSMSPVDTAQFFANLFEILINQDGWLTDG